MVRPTKHRQSKAKEDTIKEYAEWLLTLQNPQFIHKALCNAVERGGGKADPGNDKKAMRRYLLSVEDGSTESEVRRTKARKLRDQLDEDTALNAARRSQVWTTKRRPLTVQIDCLGGKKNKVVTIVRGRKGTHQRDALNRRASTSTSTGLDKQDMPPGGVNNNMDSVVCSDLPEGANARSFNDPEERSFSDDHLGGRPFELRTVGNNETGGVSCDQQEGPQYNAESRSASGPQASDSKPGLNIESIRAAPASAGASPTPSPQKQATRPHRRQVLGEVSPNVQLKQTPGAALLSKHGAESLKSGPSTVTWLGEEPQTESSEPAWYEPRDQFGFGELGQALEAAECGDGLVAGAAAGGPGMTPHGSWMTSADAWQPTGLQMGPDPSPLVGNGGNWSEADGRSHAPGNNLSDLNGAVWGYGQPGGESGGGIGMKNRGGFYGFEQRGKAESCSYETRYNHHPGQSQANFVSAPHASLLCRDRADRVPCQMGGSGGNSSGVWGKTPNKRPPEQQPDGRPAR